VQLKVEKKIKSTEKLGKQRRKERIREKSLLPFLEDGHKKMQ